MIHLDKSPTYFFKHARDGAAPPKRRRSPRRRISFVSILGLSIVGSLVGASMASASTGFIAAPALAAQPHAVASSAANLYGHTPLSYPVLHRRHVSSTPVTVNVAPDVAPASVSETVVAQAEELVSAASATDVAAAGVNPGERDQQILDDARAIGGLEANAANTSCPKAGYRIRWDAPTRIFVVGDYVGTPHAPGPSDTFVTGVVVCGDFTYGFRGFISGFTGNRWRTSFVPSRYRYGKRSDLGVIPPRTWWDGQDGLDGIAFYEPQTTCDGSVKPGTAALRAWAMARVPGSRDFGIVRNCNIGDNSEHKEGRAFDWGNNAFDPDVKAQVDALLSTLTSPDEHGNLASGARKLGIMYIIWNRQIWRAYRPSLGWQPYSGPIPHTDHVHFSMTWAGAMAETSFWSGHTVGGLASDSEPLPNEPALKYMAGQYTSRDANGVSGADFASVSVVPGPADVAAQQVVANVDGSVSVFTGPNPNYWSYFDETLEDIAPDDY